MSQFLIRSVRESDLDELLRLSRLVYFINLPDDREILKDKILNSVNSFNGNIEDKFKREILTICKTKKQLTYYEVMHQVKEDVLFIDSYNDNILAKFHRRDF